MEIIRNLDLTAIEAYVTFLIIPYAAVAVAMAIDFITGTIRARKAGIATRSRGYKMTCDKALKYFLPMLVLSCVDIIGAIILPAPAFTLMMGAFNIFCEWKSVMETTRDKEAIREAASTFSVIIKNKEDIAALLSELLTQKNDNTCEKSTK